LFGVGLSQFGGHETDGAHGGLLYILGTLIVSVFTAALLPWFVSFQQAPTIGGRLLKLGPYLAAFSYTLYLTHYPILYLMRTWHQPFATFSPISLFAYLLKIVACLLVGWLLYLPFERNTPAVRRWLASALAPVVSGKLRT
jgi:peptidoglycan/LPS O-acetylase OafA/YrhL